MVHHVYKFDSYIEFSTSIVILLWMVKKMKFIVFKIVIEEVEGEEKEKENEKISVGAYIFIYSFIYLFISLLLFAVLKHITNNVISP
jgi:hypothetical protein